MRAGGGRAWGGRAWGGRTGPPSTSVSSARTLGSIRASLLCSSRSRAPGPRRLTLLAGAGGSSRTATAGPSLLPLLAGAGAGKGVGGVRGAAGGGGPGCQGPSPVCWAAGPLSWGPGRLVQQSPSSVTFSGHHNFHCGCSWRLACRCFAASEKSTASCGHSPPLPSRSGGGMSGWGV